MVKEIAADCFIDAGTAASQLRDLRNMGYVEATQDKRESLYELREVLMRLCLEVKKQRGQWVEIFVEFLRIWYPLSERKDRLELMRGSSSWIRDEHLERALLSDEDPCFISSQRDLHRALKEEQQLLAVDTLEELLHSKRLTEKNYQELLELVKADRYSEAQQLLSEVINQVEKSEQLFSLRLLTGIELIKAEKNLEALELFDALLAEGENYADAWAFRGISLGNLGRYEEKIASFDRAISIQPDYHQVWYIRGVSLSSLGRYEEAIDSFDHAISIEPDDHEAWINRGDFLGILGRYEEAINSFDHAISIKPDDHEAWINRGDFLGNLERYEEAIHSFDQAISIKLDDNQALYKKGLTYFGWGKYEEAINCYDQAISIKPDEYDSWYEKGRVQFVMGDYPNTLTSWQQAFQIIQQTNPRPNNIAGHILLFIIELIHRFSLPNSQPQTSTLLAQLIPIYQNAEVLTELSTALIVTLPQILAPNVSDYTADQWLALWQSLLGREPALEMPLRLINTAIAYKKQPAQQKRLWLGLAKEERSILDQVLGFEKLGQDYDK